MDILDETLAACTIIGDNSMKAIGRQGAFRVQHFVDLLSGCHEEKHLTITSRSLAALVSNNLEVANYGAVACPKKGNVLLGRAVAQHLGKPSSCIRDSVLFGRRIEGIVPRGVKLILVDDVSSEGELLADCIVNARRDGFLIDSVFTVVDRKEGDATARLTDMDAKLYSCRRFNDFDLQQLVARIPTVA